MFCGVAVVLPDTNVSTPLSHLFCLQFYRQVLSSGLPYSPRRQLFSTSQDASPALRRTIICRISACTQWRGNLEHKVLPRFLALFDSDCIRFFFRCVNASNSGCQGRANSNLLFDTGPSDCIAAVLNMKQEGVAGRVQSQQHIINTASSP